jgi:hypothetical protein
MMRGILTGEISLTSSLVTGSDCPAAVPAVSCCCSCCVLLLFLLCPAAVPAVSICLVAAMSAAAAA